MLHINWTISRMQEAQSNKYYIIRVVYISRPLEVLMIIHDKMNHAKTTSPCFAHQIKVADGLFELSISLTCNMVLSNVS